MTGAWSIVREQGLPPVPGAGRVRLAAAQTDPRIGDAAGNARRAVSAAEAAHGEGARLVVFPECSLTGYCFSSREEAWEAALAPGHAAFRDLAEAAARLSQRLVVGYLERAGDDLANTVAVIGPEGVESRYRKTHLPHLGADRWVCPGDALSVQETAGLRTGFLICYDASFPEATRALALLGAEIVLLPTNWPEEAEAKADWLPNARAYENVIYFASVNRVGREREYAFHGRSRICGPTGVTLVQGPRDEECLLVADIDPARAREKRIERRPGYWVDRIGDRRTDLYGLTWREGGSER